MTLSAGAIWRSMMASTAGRNSGDWRTMSFIMATSSALRCCISENGAPFATGRSCWASPLSTTRPPAALIRFRVSAISRLPTIELSSTKNSVREKSNVSPLCVRRSVSIKNDAMVWAFTPTDAISPTARCVGARPITSGCCASGNVLMAARTALNWVVFPTPA
ncbi:Uncharacterised protein [Yersinia pekkanenii]|uniref:Uncharacterized protein n=1 Tax=Yersinia pekkanenii TaxID=1288385 RepID=A0A0T9RRZ6_9GAMM|nr:Uncharacterised protein [Yersinia pekkanenii]